uniref:Cell wall integrity and stress response component 2-like n=2 Tax=Crassostrea virginica TaxID=6565 RepID=A0A8B8ATK5_CRAVI|nr:cell wall integrity and stress response component 2-like [Crassostrea virginica]
MDTNYLRRNIYVIFLKICVIIGHIHFGTAINAPEKVYEACYGVLSVNFLKPSCNHSEVMYVRDVYTYSKPASDGCPQESSFTNQPNASCCRYNNDTTDCGWRYYGDTFKGNHYTQCVGMQQCGVPVAWNRTEQDCDPAVFMSKTNYMRQFYYCIETNFISQICIPSTKTGNELYIWNDGYPNNSSDCATSSGCACSISASKSSTIEIELLDLRLSQSGGTCNQRLVISEGGTETSIDCGQQNDFSLTSVYSSQSDSLTVRFDNTVSGQYGHFWILLRASDSTAILTMTCGNASAVYSCGETLPTTTSTTTTTMSSPSNSSGASTTGSVTSFPGSAGSTTGTVSSSDTQYSKTTAGSVSTLDPQSTGTTASSSNTSTSDSQASNAEASKSTSDEDDSSDKTSLIAGLSVGALGLAGLAVLASALRHRFRKNKVNVDDEYSEHFGTLSDANNVAPIGYRQLS